MFLSTQEFRSNEDLAQALQEHGFQFRETVYLDRHERTISVRKIPGSEAVDINNLIDEVCPQRLASDSCGYVSDYAGILCYEAAEEGMVYYDFV